MPFCNSEAILPLSTSKLIMYEEMRFYITIPMALCKIAQEEQKGLIKVN